MVVGFITTRAYKVLSLNSTDKTQLALNGLNTLLENLQTRHAPFYNSATSENTHLKSYVSLIE